MTRLIVVGTGDHARVVADLARAAGYELAGHVEPDAARLATLAWNAGAPLLGGLDERFEWAEAHRDARFVVAIGDNDVRRGLFERFRDAIGLEPVELVHPTATLLGGATIGPGAQVCAMAMIGVDARVGEDVILNSAASVDHDVILGPHSFVGPGVRLAGRVRVGEGAHVGIGAVVREGTIIGPGALVAAGAVVVDDVPAGTRVAGVPARPMDR